MEIPYVRHLSSIETYLVGEKNAPNLLFWALGSVALLKIIRWVFLALTIVSWIELSRGLGNFADESPRRFDIFAKCEYCLLCKVACFTFGYVMEPTN